VTTASASITLVVLVDIEGMRKGFGRVSSCAAEMGGEEVDGDMRFRGRGRWMLFNISLTGRVSEDLRICSLGLVSFLCLLNRQGRAWAFQ